MALAGQGKTKAMVGYLDIETTGNQSLAAIVPSAIEGKFLYWWLTSQYRHIRNLSSQDGRDGLNLEMLGSIRCPVPSPEAQKRISAFLDEKTAKIDGLITKKQALLEHLVEKRQAIITQAVTKGLDPAAPMKDSGIDWLDQIPAHWEVKRLSFVSQVIDCKHRTPEYIDDGIPLVSTTEISPYAIDYHTKRQVSDDEFTMMSEGGRRPQVGDIIYSRNASVGSAALVRDDRTICLGQDLCLIRPSIIRPEFLEHFLNSTACLVQLRSYLVGATFKRVNVDVIKKYMLPLPPPEEQTAIAEQVSVAIAKAEAIERKVSMSISALREYRSAVITSAVTGQIEGLQ
ncbi:hypothetical protein ASG37_01000 [Sphingomonas sp. Leaf407]|nr:hypothetical protein ASE97_01030 [Sphingomonas sp. Leaf42]KQT29773.1 hypothetical protein ASG37_01000 [Sphingomonas sp. Leaf407]